MSKGFIPFSRKTFIPDEFADKRRYIHRESLWSLWAQKYFPADYRIVEPFLSTDDMVIEVKDMPEGIQKLVEELEWYHWRTDMPKW